ncbi:Chemotaxis protein MotB [Luteitalea pratensis]|uniref:Chemotaxis protein MotB n=1 Tax=Luteitalea pratensis TaxID=1855912 RepID=A0A143PRG0_LUTPR|nr:flagellar motor protein MotB [Luteitalea pratensis]AMY10389.1 Chemotaxis protein MotB [Luteitalea pratensis]
MSARRSRRRMHQAHTASHERWLVSYADFITLLFAFFTTMYAISTVDARKLTTMVDSMQEAFDSRGIDVAAPKTTAPRPVTPTAPSLTTEQRERALAQRLRERLAGSAVDIEIDHRGVVVSMREAGSFPTGSADLSAVARDVLRELAATLGGDSAVALRVEGHTDDVPIQTGRFRSNWELSTARATSVVTYLVEQVGVAPRRLSAAGYGEFHPRVANASDADRARNRRVDVIILNEETAAAEEPGSRAPAAGGEAGTRSTMPSGRVFAG